MRFRTAGIRTTDGVDDHSNFTEDRPSRELVRKWGSKCPLVTWNRLILVPGAELDRSSLSSVVRSN